MSIKPFLPLPPAAISPQGQPHSFGLGRTVVGRVRSFPVPLALLELLKFPIPDGFA